jgi:hypothetical protein
MVKGTIHGIHSILSGAFEAAMRWEWTDRTPVTWQGDWRLRQPLSSALARQVHWHLSKGRNKL